MKPLSHTQNHALRVALSTPQHLLLRRGKKYSDQFIGGSRINQCTVDSLLKLDLMRRVEGSTSVALTQAGLAAARHAAEEYQRASAVASAKRAHTFNLYRQRRAASNPYGNTDLSTRRLPYAD